MHCSFSLEIFRQLVFYQKDRISHHSVASCVMKSIVPLRLLNASAADSPPLHQRQSFDVGVYIPSLTAMMCVRWMDAPFLIRKGLKLVERMNS